MNVFDIKNLADRIDQCVEDMNAAVVASRIGLDAQVRAYDLLDYLLSLKENGLVKLEAESAMSAEAFCKVFESHKVALENAYDESALGEELVKRLAQLQENLNEIRFKAAAAASLHEFTKEVYQVWQTSGVFARRRALRDLRERAGFRLESHRIGNYVAKTYDLMNEAQAQFGKAQQALFAEDVKYKIRPWVYSRTDEVLKSML
ncbi:MAG: hypothetical protein IKW20_05055 [Bacteroidales bacterium]|nr:hypothetical protein [Bacteroidales bacterium]